MTFSNLSGNYVRGKVADSVAWKGTCTWMLAHIMYLHNMILHQAQLSIMRWTCKTHIWPPIISLVYFCSLQYQSVGCVLTSVFWGHGECQLTEAKLLCVSLQSMHEVNTSRWKNLKIFLQNSKSSHKCIYLPEAKSFFFGFASLLRTGIHFFILEKLPECPANQAPGRQDMDWSNRYHVQKLSHRPEEW